ncbi:MAG: hypothetical protein RL514_1521 [Verrucomicrobiota bacterium]|jgi:hypothetical protein
MLWSLALGVGSFAGVPPILPPTEVPAPPTFAQLASNVMARSQWERMQKTTAQFTFLKLRVLEEFDGKGKLESSKQSRQECFPINGVPFARTIQKDGRALTDKELKTEEVREAAVRAGKKPASSPEHAKRDKEWQFTDEMLARYTFKVTGQEAVRGRPAWVVEFAPRSKDLPVNKVTDRVANKVAGKIWVDAEDWELARMKFWLTEEVQLIGGVVGVLRKFEMLLERTRVEPNAWLPTTIDFDMAGRELVTNKRVHYHEEAKGFKRVAPPPKLAPAAPASEAK